MLIFTQRLRHPGPSVQADLSLALTAEERSRSRHRFEYPDGTALFFQLPRGTLLLDGDLLQTEDGSTRLQIQAKPEPVITVRSQDALELLQAAYHLGNRHVALEAGEDAAGHYLRLQPDAVLEAMLHHRGLSVTTE
jgi:urease accessory protein